jgi:hypothetical protein
MPRPPDVPDPLDPAAPIRTDDPVMDRARAQTTLAELLRSRTTRWWAKLPVEYEPLVVPEIPPERLAELRRRRDEILAALRERRGAVYDAAAIHERSTASENASRQRGSLAGVARRSLAGVARRSKPTSQVGSSAAAAEMKEIAALMRDSGLTVLASSGWESRGLSSSVNYWAVIAHHTAATTDIDNILINGRSDLAGPLCNWALHDNGDWVLIASGRANHAGEGTIPSSEAYGVEATGPHGYPNTYGPAAFHNYDEYELGSACMLAVMGANINDLFGHKETARPVGRKIDPYFDMDPFRKGAAAAEEGDELNDADRNWIEGRLDAHTQQLLDTMDAHFKLLARGEYKDGTIDTNSTHYKDSHRGLFQQISDINKSLARGEINGAIDPTSQHYADSHRGIMDELRRMQEPTEPPPAR